MKLKWGYLTNVSSSGNKHGDDNVDPPAYTLQVVDGQVNASENTPWQRRHTSHGAQEFSEAWERDLRSS